MAPAPSARFVLLSVSSIQLINSITLLFGISNLIGISWFRRVDSAGLSSNIFSYSLSSSRFAGGGAQLRAICIYGLRVLSIRIKGDIRSYARDGELRTMSCPTLGCSAT